MIAWLALPVRPALILWPLLGHVAFVFALYAWLTAARARAVKAGEIDYGAFQFNRGEPDGIARITRNLANQFELPVLFYAAVLLLLHFDAICGADIALAWLFLAGRSIHTFVQTLTGDVELRGKVFMINFLAVVGLLAHVGWLAITR